MVNEIGIGFLGAVLALVLKSFYDYWKEKKELNILKKVLVTDLYHQCASAGYFRLELEKINQIYSKGLDAIEKKMNYNFYEDLQTTIFNEVFFSKETFNTISKPDLLKILNNDSRNFGEVHNIYHITERLKNRNITYYEDLYDEHLLAYIEGIEENQIQRKSEALRKALRYITLKLKADMNSAETISSMSYGYLVKIIGKKQLKSEFGIELSKQ